MNEMPGSPRNVSGQSLRFFGTGVTFCPIGSLYKLENQWRAASLYRKFV